MYIDETDLIERYGESLIRGLADPDGAGAADGGTLESAIADACAEIDLYLAARYALPLADPPEALKRMACVLARDVLAADSDVFDERWREAADRVRDVLKDIAAGRASLGVDDAAPSPGGAGADVVSGGRRWGRSDSEGFL